jgi:hypothetical protein
MKGQGQTFSVGRGKQKFDKKLALNSFSSFFHQLLYSIKG